MIKLGATAALISAGGAAFCYMPVPKAAVATFATVFTLAAASVLLAASRKNNGQPGACPTDR